MTIVLITLIGLLPPQNPALAQSTVTLSGIWKLDAEGYRYLQSDGSTVDENVRGTIVAQFSEVKNGFTGSYVSVFSDLCSNVEIKGSTQNNHVNWVAHFNAPCECQGAETMFEGTLSQDGKTMTGTISPVRPPPSPDCRVWWANVTATKVTASATLNLTEGPRGKTLYVNTR
jgi:hypothetical protein